MGEILKRGNVDDAHKWDLGSLYQSIDQWHMDFESLAEDVAEVVKFEGKILDSADNLLGLLEASNSVIRKLTNLFTFAKMKQDEDTRIAEFQELKLKSESMGVKINEAMSFVIPEILHGDAKTIKAYVSENDGLSLYDHYLEELLKRKPHTLSASEERLLALSGELAMAPQNVFGMLNAADLKFPTIKDAEDNDLKLTHGNFVPTMESKNREVRKEAFEKYYSVFDDHKNTFGALVNAEVKKNVFYAKARNHSTSREAALFENTIPVAVYDQLIEAVHDNLPHMHKYMALRKKMLGVDELHMYDIYTPIVKDVEMKVTYDQARAMVLEGLKPLGKDYLDVVTSSFEEGWIDVYENEGKRSGAYSWGTYDSKPYILLNYHDNLDNAFTLAHEMGHSMHSHLTRKNQAYIYGDYSIFLAEVASTTNEALLNDHLLRTTEDPKKRLYILNHYLEQFRGTIYRQTMFAEYERDIHQIVENGGALTEEKLSEMYGELNRKYYGSDMVIDDQIKLEWARIPHFYYNFYVFQYATGFSAAIALSQRILNEGEGALEDYLNFLSSGSSDYPIEILKKAGADMTTGKPVEDALKLFGELVEEMEKLL